MEICRLEMEFVHLLNVKSGFTGNVNSFQGFNFLFPAEVDFTFNEQQGYYQLRSVYLRLAHHTFLIRHILILDYCKGYCN